VSTNRTSSGRRELASRPRRPRLTAYRKVTKAGNSLYIAPPRPFLHALGVVKGDMVELVLDEFTARFYVNAVKRRAPLRPPVPPDRLPLEDAK